MRHTAVIYGHLYTHCEADKRSEIFIKVAAGYVIVSAIKASESNITRIRMSEHMREKKTKKPCC